MKVQLLAAIFFLAATQPILADQGYDDPLIGQEAFQQSFEQRDFRAAFEILLVAESSATAHPADLVFLAGFYVLEELDDLGTQQERGYRFWTLTERAALTGWESAVIELQNAYDDGDELVGFGESEEAADCIEQMFEDRAYVDDDWEWMDRDRVQKCIAVADHRDNIQIIK